MKRISLILVLSIFWLSACEDYLDIEPQQAISSSLALSTKGGIKTALIGTYELMISLSRFDGNEVFNSDLMIDDNNLLWTGYSTDLQRILNKNLTTRNGPTEGLWINNYRVINQTNSIINALEVVNDGERNTLEAEARFLRGMAYFDLVNLFAKSWGDGDPRTNLGVPLVNQPSEQSLANPFIPRNSVEEIYQFILDDFSFASNNLPDQNGVFATSYAARVLLSRLYLMKEQYLLAESEADQVISSDVFSLLSEPLSIYNTSMKTVEDIFSLQYTAESGVNNTSYFYSGEIEGGGGFVGISDDHMAKYEEDDIRKTLFYFDQQVGIRRTSKWKPTPSNDGNRSLARLAEMYLTRSECRFRNGNIEGAVNDLNIIRNRAGLSEISTGEITLEVILKERFLELVFEGHQFRDVKRTRQSVGDMTFNDPRLIFPIPQREMDVNKALVQNTGY